MKMTREQLLERFAAGEEFVNADLSEIDLSGADLRDITFLGANLSGAYLRGADLSDANLREANFTGADFAGSNLSRAYLRLANLTLANLQGVTLCGADFSEANLRRANLYGADFTEAGFGGANLREANLTNVKLFKAPIVQDLDKRICAVVEARLDGDSWHGCDTAHHRAGWAVMLAGSAGKVLAELYGPRLAGALIYHASTGHVPDFFASDEDALADIKKRAGIE